jgi:uncharacterized delta-60 repeat protein
VEISILNNEEPKIEVVMAGYDLTFDGNGRATTDLGGLHDQIKALIPIANGQILVAGTDDSSTLIIFRYNPDGSLDPSFGTAGKVNTGIVNSSIYSLPNGNIIVSGIPNNSNINSNSSSIFQYLANGQLDLSFGANGQYIVPTSSPTIVPRLNPVDGTEEIFIGKSNGSFDNLVITLNAIDAKGKEKSFTLNGINIPSNLSLDVSVFNKIVSSQVVDKTDPKNKMFYDILGESVINEFRSRVAATNIKFFAIIPKPLTDGTIVNYFLGDQYAFFVTRFNSDANVTIDSSFGTNGLGAIPFDFQLDKSNRFIFTSYDPSTASTYIGRLTKNGLPDITFGNNGQIKISTPGDGAGNSTSTAILVDSQDRIILTTKLPSENVTNVFRIDRNGILDNSFGTNGKLQLAAETYNYDKVSQATVILATDDRLFLSGSTFVSSRNQDILVSKYDITNLINVSPRNDFNGDGKSDILWRNDYGSIAIWQMNGSTVTNGALTSISSVDSSWKTAGTGDFDGDGKSDILWRNDDGRVVLWTMNGANVLSSNLTSTPALDNSWKTAGIGDFDGNGNSDILWRNDNGAVAIWGMNGTNVLYSKLTSTPTLNNSWKTAGIGDFDGDGKSDILWRNDDGSVALWQINGAGVTASTAVSKIGTDWKISGTGDFNGDGKADILWRNDDGSVALWQMNGAAITSRSLTSIPSLDSSQTIAGIGDYNGDGNADILWRKDSGATDVWAMNGSTVLSSTLTSIQPDSSSWKITAPII